MPRAHRLLPLTVTHEQVFHAYTSPPIPEKGAPPTIIVTPAEPVSAQDFQVHFYSPTPSRSMFFQTSSRLSRLLSRLPGSGSGPKPEAESGRAPMGLGISTRWQEDRHSIVAYNGSELYSPVPTSEYGAIRLQDEELDDQEIVVIKRKEKKWSATKKMRVTLFLMLPMLLVLFHLFTAWTGFGTLETEAYHEYDDVLHDNLWEWSPTDAVAIDEPHATDVLTAGGIVPDIEHATMTLGAEGAPTPIALIENDAL